MPPSEEGEGAEEGGRWARETDRLGEEGRTEGGRGMEMAYWGRKRDNPHRERGGGLREATVVGRGMAERERDKEWKRGEKGEGREKKQELGR